MTKVCLQSLVLFSQQGEKSATSSSGLVSSLTLIFKPCKANSFRPRARKRICKWPSLLEFTEPSLAKAKQSFSGSLLLSQCTPSSANSRGQRRKTLHALGAKFKDCSADLRPQQWPSGEGWSCLIYVEALLLDCWPQVSGMTSFSFPFEIHSSLVLWLAQILAQFEGSHLWVELRHRSLTRYIHYMQCSCCNNYWSKFRFFCSFLAMLKPWGGLETIKVV